MTGPAPQFVREVPAPLPATAMYDVVMCGGTLGVFLACALQLKGLRCMLLLKPTAADASCIALHVHPPCTTHPGRIVLQTQIECHCGTLICRACRVAVVERGPLKGREQEWNISRKELIELVRHIQPACTPACDGHVRASSALRQALSGKSNLTCKLFWLVIWLSEL